MVYVPVPVIFTILFFCPFFLKPSPKNFLVGLLFCGVASLVFIILVRRSIRKYGLVYPDKATWLRFVFDRWYMNIIFLLPGLINKEWIVSAAMFASIFLLSFLYAPGIMNLVEGSRRRFDAYVKTILVTPTNENEPTPGL